MANVNKVVRRRQVALLIALILGIGAGGVGTWMVSEMNLKKAPPAKAPKGEPAPDMTGVVNQSFDNKVQRSAIAEAQRLNKETQTEIKKLRTEMGLIGRDLKGSQDRIRELEDENKLLQTQLEAGKNFDSLNAEPLPGALASQGKPAPAGAVAGLVKESNTGGVQIDPTTFRKYNITAVPVLIVACGNQGDTVDRLQGDLTLHQALKRVAEEGDCADTARHLLGEEAQ